MKVAKGVLGAVMMAVAVAVAVAVVLWIGVAITRGAYLILGDVTGIIHMLEQSEG